MVDALVLKIWMGREKFLKYISDRYDMMSLVSFPWFNF